MRLLPCLLLAAAMLAGCAGPEPAAGNDPAPATPAANQIAWGLDGCLHAVWSAPAPLAVLAAHVPAGFTPRANAAGVGMLSFEAFECDAGLGLDGPVQELAYGSIFIAVQAPDEYGCAGLPGGCYVKTDVLVPDAARRDWLQAAGVAARDGTADVSVDAAGTWTASLVMEGVGGFGMQGAQTPPSAGGDAGFAEFMQATGGVAVWRATATDVAVGTGTGAWSADPGTWVANEVGVAGPTTWSGGTWSFVDGTLAVP